MSMQIDMGTSPQQIASNAIEKAILLFPSSGRSDIRSHFAKIREALEKMPREALEGMFPGVGPFIPLVLPGNISFIELMATTKVLGERIRYPEKDDLFNADLRDARPRRAVLLSGLRTPNLTAEFCFMNGADLDGDCYVDRLPAECLSLTETLAAMFDWPRWIIDANQLYTSTRVFAKDGGKEVGFMGIRWISNGRTHHTELFVQDKYEKPEGPYRCLCADRTEL